MTKIFIHASVDAPGLERLRGLRDVQVTIIPTDEEPDDWQLSDVGLEAAVHMWAFPPANLAETRRLEFLQLTSAGFTQLHGLGLAERGVRACNAAGVFDPTIAEWNLAMMVNLARDLRGMIRHQEAGVWERHAVYQREIRGLVVGLWGYGGIARATARLCKALGMKVLALTRAGVTPRDATYCEEGTGDPAGTLPDRIFLADGKDEFLSQLDFLVMCVPLSSSTEGMVGEHELEMLPQSAYILNPARGPLIREAALLEALREHRIAGAALDTHYYYPMPADHPLWQMPNVIMTPHISGSGGSPHYKRRLWDIFVANVERYLAGRPLINRLRADQLQQ